MRARHLLIALAAGLALADAAIVTLALPQLLNQLGTTVEGVASILGVYTVVLAAALLPAELVQRRVGAARTAAGGMALFAVASVACG
ncbi:MAG TPA: MFS transporter, partial [Baekduia sp.]|nr:MFS transporter [Baekduia sp.]